MRRLRALAVLLLLATVASCQPTNEEEEEEPVETAAMDEAAIQVQDRALVVAAHLGVPLTNPIVLPDLCSDPSGERSETGVYYMSGGGQLRVGEDRMTEALNTMQSYYLDHGFEVGEIRWSSDGSGAGQLRATDPDGFGFSMRPTVSRNAYAFTVSSPCYQAPEGEDPTDGRWHPLPHPTWDAQPGAPR